MARIYWLFFIIFALYTCPVYFKPILPALVQLSSANIFILIRFMVLPEPIPGTLGIMQNTTPACVLRWEETGEPWRLVVFHFSHGFLFYCYVNATQISPFLLQTPCWECLEHGNSSAETASHQNWAVLSIPADASSSHDFTGHHLYH